MGIELDESEWPIVAHMKANAALTAKLGTGPERAL
jgi:hypothetical protein